MHTGYDNFWVYQNNRHEPVLNIPKNDNYSQAILTDSCKQMQNGGCPSHLNSYISPQNNDASSHQNNQHRTLDSNYMWTSSVYSMPLKFSNSRNVHPQEAFLVQSNNAPFLNSQPQQYSGFRYLKNSNANVSQMYKNNSETDNYSNCENSVSARNNENTKAQTQRIRVKDVFSLNNSTVYYQFLSHQPHLKEQQECALNYPTVNYTRAGTSQIVPTQSEIINFGKNSIPQQPSTYYGHTTAAEEPSQYLHYSGSFYQQNTECTPESQFQFKTGRSIKQNLQLEASKTNTSVPLLRQLLYSGNGQEPKSQIERSYSNSLYENTRVKIMQQRHSVPINNLDMTNNSGYAGSLEVNTGLIQKSSNLDNVTQIQHQENFTRINVACLPTSSSAAPLTSKSAENITSNGKAHSYEQISGEDVIVKISYPHNFQSACKSLHDLKNTDKNSKVNLPFLLESNDKFFSTLKKNSPIDNNNIGENKITNLPETSQGNFSNSQAPSIARSSPVLAQNCQASPRERLHPKELFIDLNKESETSFLNSNETCVNTLENFSAMNDNGGDIIPKATIVQNYPSNIMALKQENYNDSMESPSTTNHISEGKVLFEIIKTEADYVDENPEDSTMEEYEAQSSGKPGALTESFVVDGSEDLYFTKVDVDDEFVLGSEKSQIISTDMEDCQGVVNFNTNSLTEEKIERDEAEVTEVVDPKKNYKSKINRDKLDMLIQFLEADEPVETKLKPPRKKKLRSNNDRKKGVDLNHNRRKLNKTRIVRNKNMAREMISYKIARVELTKCSSRPSHILKENSSKIRERKYSNVEARLSEQIRDISGKPSPEGNCKIQEEQNFLRTMRTLQSLKTHFCVGCGLVSPIDSFWVNVASGELRCFNCFRKVAVKGRQNAFKSKPDDYSNFEGESIQKYQAEGNRENINRCEWVTKNNVKATDKSDDFCKVENADVKSIDAIKEIKLELITGERQMEDENTRKKGIESSYTFRKQSVSSENKTSVKGRCWENQKKPAVKDPVKINKSKEVSVTHRAKHSEDTQTVEVKEKKGGDSSSQHRKRNDCKDSKLLEEHTKKEEKRVNVGSDASAKKTKESHNTYKDYSEEQIIKKNAKHEVSEKSKTQSLSVERDTCQKPKPSEQAKPKELNSLDESKKKSLLNLNSAEKHKKTDTVQSRKRKNSEEDVGSSKIRILEDNTGRENTSTKTTCVLKEDSAEPKNKVLDNERRKNSAEKSRKNSLSKEEGDHPKKETKQILDSSDTSKMKDFLKGDAAYQKMKIHGQAKQKTSDLPRRNSKEEQTLSSFDKRREGSTSKEGSKSPTSSLQEFCKKGTKHGSSSMENNDRKKADEKEKKHSSGKTQKNSNSEKDSEEKVVTSIGNAGHPRKSDTALKPLKECRNNKVRSVAPSVNLKNKESQVGGKEVKKHVEGRKDEKKIDKNMREKEVTNLDRKKDWEGLERVGKCGKSEAEKRDASEKSVAFGWENEAHLKTAKRTLLQELIKKTKKLSWNLLSDV